MMHNDELRLTFNFPKKFFVYPITVPYPPALRLEGIRIRLMFLLLFMRTNSNDTEFVFCSSQRISEIPS